MQVYVDTKGCMTTHLLACDKCTYTRGTEYMRVRISMYGWINVFDYARLHASVCASVL